MTFSHNLVKFFRKVFQIFPNLYPNFGNYLSKFPKTLPSLSNFPTVERVFGHFSFFKWLYTGISLFMTYGDIEYVICIYRAKCIATFFLMEGKVVKKWTCHVMSAFSFYDRGVRRCSIFKLVLHISLFAYVIYYFLLINIHTDSLQWVRFIWNVFMA